MGAQLVGLVLANHCSLSDRAFRVAVRMAHSALDTPNSKGQPAAVYFGGWELLALTLGYTEDELEDDPKTRASAKKTVQRAIAELRDRGLIEGLLDSKRVHSGTRQSYRLQLTGRIASVAATVDNDERGSATDPQWGSAIDPLSERKGVSHGPERGSATDPPRKEEEPGTTQDESQDTCHSLAASTTDRAREAETGIDITRPLRGHYFAAADRRGNCNVCHEPRTSAKHAGWSDLAEAVGQ